MWSARRVYLEELRDRPDFSCVPWGPLFSCPSCQTWKPQTEQMRNAGPAVPKGLAGL